jgi:hypothetical protein
MKIGQLLALVGLGIALVAGTRALWPRTEFVPGPPPAPTVVDVTEETRAAYEDQVGQLQQRLADALAAPAPENVTDTLWRTQVERVPIPCAAPAGADSTTITEAVLPGMWYLVDAVFPQEPGAEGLVGERYLEVVPGALVRQDQLRQLYMAGPITGIQAGPDGLQFGFGSWPTPSCRWSTKATYLGVGMGLTGLAAAIFGGD